MLARNAPRTSALYRAQEPDAADWSLEALLLADVADVQHWLQWAKTKDGAAGRNQPKPIPRPGVEEDKAKHIRGTPEDVNDIVEWLGEDFAAFAI